MTVVEEVALATVSKPPPRASDQGADLPHGLAAAEERRLTGGAYAVAVDARAAQGGRHQHRAGAVTKRVDRCVEQGWVTRRVRDTDARGRVIALTDAGRAVIDQAFEAHMANEHRLVGLLAEDDRARLAQLLETWGRALDA